MADAMKKAWTDIQNSSTAGAKSAVKSANNMKSAFSSLGGTVSRLGGLLTKVIGPISFIYLAKKCLDLGSSVTEVQNVVDTAFGSMAYKMESFAKSSIKNFGMSELAAKKTGSTYMSMAKSMGIATEDASEMAVTLTGLTGDVASFYNISQDVASTRLKAVFTGETEAIKELGVVMTQTNLEQYALSKGINKSISSMTQAELVTLRYHFVLDSLNMTSGDFVKTQNSWANQTRILSEQIKALGANLGKILTTVLVPALKALNRLLEGLVSITSFISSAVSSFFGANVSQNNQIASSATDAAEAENALAAGIGNAAKAAKKSLAGFDDLNILQSDTAAGSAGASGGLSGSVDFNLSQAEKDSSAISQAWANTAEKVKELYYEVLGKISVKNLENSRASLTNLSSGWDNLSSTIGGANGSLSDFLANMVDMNQIGYAGQNKIFGGLMDMIAEFRRNYSETGETGMLAWIKGAFTDKDVWDSFGEMFAGWGMAASAYLPESGIMGVSKEEWENLFLPVTEEYTNLYRDLSTEAAESLAEYNAISKQLSTKLKKVDWSDAIITDQDIREVDQLTAQLFNTVTRRNADARKAAEDSIASLIEEGLISEEDGMKAIQDLNEVYDANAELIQGNQEKILGILQKAKSEKRSLTEEENSQIMALMNEFNDETIAVIKQGASDSDEIYKMIEENRGKMTKQMLSQTIQFANDEYAAKVKAAEDTYAASIANADRLYHDLGVIDAEEYERIKKDAEEKKNIQIQEAQLAKDALIKEAQGAADGVADAVDPETGEILSNWEVLWNSMFTKVNTVWTNITSKCKGFINRILGFINGLISGVGSGINAVISALNKLNVKIPKWVPKYGGETFGFNLRAVTVRQIPYLAQGAVLPPNKPFMAVVGDQKHGTNIEAPLTTIQEAVANVMGEQTSALVAGFEASIGVQREILQALLGISIGDDVIGQAVSRYNRKMAVVRGG
jgi:hypothetical protein